MKAEIHPKVTETTIPLGSRNITIREAPDTNHRINLKGEYKVSTGPLDFDVVIEFGDLYKDIEGKIIPPEKRWTDYQNGDARVLTNHPDGNIATHTLAATKQITEIAKNKSLDDPTAVREYGSLVNILTAFEKQEVQNEIQGATPIVALRAGLPMTEALGYQAKDMVLMDAKRLNGEGKNAHKLALGLRFEGSKDEIMKKLKDANGKFVNADPALATGSTQLGILLWLLSNNIDVKEFTALSIGAAQQGLEMLNESADQLRKSGYQFAFNTITAGLHPELTSGEHPYYIKTAEGDFAVGDGGDFLDLLLPGDLRKRWADKVTSVHISRLKGQTDKIDWSTVIEGQEIDLQFMLKIQKILLEVGNKTLVGSIFCKPEQKVKTVLRDL